MSFLYGAEVTSRWKGRRCVGLVVEFRRCYYIGRESRLVHAVERRDPCGESEIQVENCLAVWLFLVNFYARIIS